MGEQQVDLSPRRYEKDARAEREHPRRSIDSLGRARRARPCFPAFLTKLASRAALCAHSARVVKWQTRTFEGRMPKGMGVQVPPRAFLEQANRSGPALWPRYLRAALAPFLPGVSTTLIHSSSLLRKMS
jgi:hypothetical protein